MGIYQRLSGLFKCLKLWANFLRMVRPLYQSSTLVLLFRNFAKSYCNIHASILQSYYNIHASILQSYSNYAQRILLINCTIPQSITLINTFLNYSKIIRQESLKYPKNALFHFSNKIKYLYNFSSRCERLF